MPTFSRITQFIPNRGTKEKLRVSSWMILGYMLMTITVWEYNWTALLKKAGFSPQRHGDQCH